LIPGINKEISIKSHNWYVSVVANGQQASDEFKFTTDPIFAVNPSHCKGIDPDEEKDEFQKKGCILDRAEMKTRYK